jgi:hypothetical protein
MRSKQLHRRLHGRAWAEGEEMSVRRHDRWTPEEDDILRQGALAGRTAFEIASLVGRTESAVRMRAYTLRVPLRQITTRPR